MKWIAAHPEFVDLWYDDLEPDDFVVDEYDNVDGPIEVLRVLLGAADAGALARFERVYDDGFAQDPPNWAGDRLLALRDALSAVPDTSAPREGLWELADETVVALAPTLPWTSRYVGRPADVLRESILAEWHTARTLHAFVDRAVTDDLAIIWD